VAHLGHNHAPPPETTHSQKIETETTHTQQKITILFTKYFTLKPSMPSKENMNTTEARVSMLEEKIASMEVTLNEV